MNFLRQIGFLTLSLALTALLVSLGVPVLSQAPEEDIIPPCYNAQELAKVREWEKTWVGKKVNGAMVDQVKDLLPEPCVTIMKEPAKWGAKDLWFEVVPYRYCAPTKGVLEATKKYSPMAKFSPKGFKTTWGEVYPNEFLEGYEKGDLAGFPFPKAKTGLEMAWNYNSITWGDSHYKEIFGEVVNGRTGAERHALQPQYYLWWTGRTDIAPIPRIEPNPKGIHRSLYQTLLEPPDMYGTNFLDITYADPRKENEMYIWVAMYRRIRKMTTSQRGDTIDGSDQSYCDQEGYADQVNRNTYKFIELKDMLGCRHQDVKNFTKVHGQAYFSGFQRERCKLYMIEVTPKAKDHIYTKELWYLDAETWQMLYKQTWDQQGKLWRFLDEQIGYMNSEQGVSTPFITSYTYCDMQRIHGGPNIHRNPKIGLPLKTDMFTVQYLQKAGY